MQVEYKDIRTGNKGTDKFRVSEEVEVADLDWKEVDFEAEKNGELEFSDEDGEPFMLPKSFFDTKLPWLRPGVAVQVRMFDEEPLYYRFANRYQILQIKHTREVDQITPRGKPAELTNGVVVKVPIFLQNDAWVKVDVITEEYVSKEDGPPAEEDDE
jgi:elongation factor P